MTDTSTYYASCDISNRDRCDHQHTSRDDARQCARDYLLTYRAGARAICAVSVAYGRTLVTSA